MKMFQHVINEPEVKGAYGKMLAETQKVFKAGTLFEGLIKEYTPKEESGEPLAREQKDVVTTVGDRLAWQRASIQALMDYELTKDTGNTQAKADLVVGEQTLCADVPVTTLLSLETRLREIRESYDAIPTLDLSRKWTREDQSNIYRNGPHPQYRTAKKTVPVIMYHATKEHPAQVKDVIEDVGIGVFQTTYFSGAIHPGEKAAYLKRIDNLIVCVKQARMKANEHLVTGAKIGEAIFKYIHEK